MNLLQTTTTYATYANAEKTLSKKLALIGRTLQDTRYLIACNAEGRFAPVVLASNQADQANVIPLAHYGITVVG